MNPRPGPRRTALCAVLLLCAAPLTPCNALPLHAGGTQEVDPAAVHPPEETGHAVRIEGTVLLPGGAPAGGAVVVPPARATGLLLRFVAD